MVSVHGSIDLIGQSDLGFKTLLIIHDAQLF